ncbi:unnamed protein product [Prorocentrum cordatum]|uniref:3-deoxy-7-phosphoheptulonate synthase n=1 Tax=Prorocentrum cordatum TaxID=2364126 RepID=A0ABN9WNC1_9DINO|nr:unnamed protein product [Polarella glacialis]|mmetsp:Transcript_59144/g.159316  ORF Transcript_59144/g.159316 Transcript_59144/m.159316 type:complete len:193 (-) Transcript_59144:131-709(-)
MSSTSCPTRPAAAGRASALPPPPPSTGLSPLLMGLTAVTRSRRKSSALKLGAASREGSEKISSGSSEVPMVITGAEDVLHEDVLHSKVKLALYAGAEAVRLKSPQLTPRSHRDVRTQEASMLKEALDQVVAAQSPCLDSVSPLSPALDRCSQSPPKHRRGARAVSLLSPALAPCSAEGPPRRRRVESAATAR